MSEQLSHATLSDRELRDQHGISSISGLDDALATLAANDHETRRYAYDAMHASHSSIHHASVAVAEAAYIESILKKIDELHAEMSAQRSEVQELMQRVNTALAEMPEYLSGAETASEAARAYAIQSEAAATAATAVSQTVASIRDLLQNAMDAASTINTSVVAAESAAQNAESAYQNSRLSADQASSNAQAAQESAITAYNAANNVMASAQQAIDTATTAANTARQAAEATVSIVDSVTQYAAQAQDAAVSAQQASQAANEATTARTGMDELVAAAHEYAERAEYAAGTIEGTVHFRGRIGAVSCLPEEGAIVGDMWYCAEEHAYYLYTSDGWHLQSNVRQWAAVSENEPPSQTSMSHFREGSVFTVIIGDASQPVSEPASENATTVVLNWVGIVEALPDAVDSTDGDACLYNGQIYMFEEGEWAPISDESGEMSWQLHTDSITEEELAAITQALGGTEPVILSPAPES